MAPCRFESRVRSGPRISGTCAKIGARAPSASIDQRLLRRIRKMIGAANHVGDAHVDIVDHHAELIGGQRRSSAAGRNPRSRRSALRADRKQHPRILSRRFAARGTESPVGFRPSSLAARSASLRSRQGQAGPFCSFGPSSSPSPSSLRRRRRGIGSGIGGRLCNSSESRAAREQALGGRPVHLQALRLKKRPFIPFDPEPFQSVEDSVDQLRAVALDVRILDPQQERAALVPREEPIEQRGSARLLREDSPSATGRNERAAFLREPFGFLRLSRKNSS